MVTYMLYWTKWAWFIHSEVCILLTSSNIALIFSTEEYSVEISLSTWTDLSRISFMVSVLMREWCLVKSLCTSCTWSFSIWISVCRVWTQKHVTLCQPTWVKAVQKNVSMLQIQLVSDHLSNFIEHLHQFCQFYYCEFNVWRKQKLYISVTNIWNQLIDKSVNRFILPVS